VQSSSQTTAVVVTYNPDGKQLSALLKALASQAVAIVVVDNGSKAEDVLWLKKEEAAGRLHLRLLGENLGVAAALNRGIEVARDLRSDYVALFDHDSLPAPDMIFSLVKAAEAKAAEGWKVGSLGPRYVDPRQDNPPPFIRIRGLRLERRTCASPDDVVEVDYLISSGCLIPMSTLREVGPMREDLFIDYIDIEWGLRAKAKGFQSFGVCGAEMFHSLGEEPISFLGKKFPNHSPLRHYYHFRNAIHLYREPWAPLNWKAVDAWKLLQKFGFYSLFGKPRCDHFSMMSRGLLHGLVGKSGRLKFDS
jgi:rhamnosyltransferase